MVSDVPVLFAASLLFDQRKAVEAHLEAPAGQKASLSHLLQIMLARSQPMQVGQLHASAVCLL